MNKATTSRRRARRAGGVLSRPSRFLVPWVFGLALSLTACVGAVRVAAPLVIVNVTRIMSSQAGGTAIRQAGSIRVARLAGDLTATALDAYLTRKGGQEADWTLVVTRGTGAATTSEVFAIAFERKVYVRTHGQTLQSFEPSKRTVTITAETGDTSIAILDTDQEPVRAEGSFQLLRFSGTTDFDFDSGKRSGGGKDSDIHLAWKASPLIARNGAQWAKVSDDPTLGDCTTVKPGDWKGDVDSVWPYGDYCFLSSEGRFGKMHYELKGFSYKLWETAKTSS
ncbi:hypothetical protein [Streptomyces sp. NPDC058872]|uniref:hypothetical protein n=1 Tax=Streptomyces sp. NPDC058872 TaxID=3346661 RepID=UPI0036BA2A60